MKPATPRMFLSAYASLFRFSHIGNPVLPDMFALQVSTDTERREYNQVSRSIRGKGLGPRLVRQSVSLTLDVTLLCIVPPLPDCTDV